MPVISGKKMKLFLESRGCQFDRRKEGSHMVLLKGNVEIVIPDHRELAKGTMLSILRTADISREEFINHFHRRK